MEKRQRAAALQDAARNPRTTNHASRLAVLQYYQLPKFRCKFPNPLGKEFSMVEKLEVRRLAAVSIAVVSMGSDGWDVP